MGYFMKISVLRFTSKTVVVISLFMASIAGQSAKQQAVKMYKDWSVFVGYKDKQKVCYIATTSKGSEAGKPNIHRDEVYLMVANRPSDNVKNEISFVSGYPLKKRSVVTVAIGSEQYDMFTQNNGAWTASAKEDQKLIDSMHNNTVIVLMSAFLNDASVVDTFSLAGFTDALEDAQNRCAY